jgi:hypothetical protein
LAVLIVVHSTASSAELIRLCAREATTSLGCSAIGMSRKMGIRLLLAVLFDWAIEAAGIVLRFPHTEDARQSLNSRFFPKIGILPSNTRVLSATSLPPSAISEFPLFPQNRNSAPQTPTS